MPMVSSLVAGVEVNFSESTAALVNVSTDADVTFWASRLESVNAWNLSSIVGLGMQTGQALFSDFNAIGCNAASALITLQPDISVDAEDSRTVQIQNSSFSKSAVRAVYIASYSSAVVADSNFYLSVGSALTVRSSGQLEVHNSTLSGQYQMAQLLWICSCKGFESGILTSQTAPAVQFLSGLHKMSAYLILDLRQTVKGL